jgi:hypothetical protein
MRLWMGLLILASVGCKKKADSPASTGSAAVAGDATVLVASDDAVAATVDAGVDAAVAVAAGPPFCLDRDADEDVVFREVAKDAASLTFCLDLEERVKCAKLDLATGTLAGLAVVPAAKGKENEGKALDTSKLDLPKDHEYATAVSPDGKTIAATTDIEGKLFLVDAATGKTKKVVTWKGDGGCMEAPSFIGDHVYVQYNVCAGPGATGWIVTADGKKLGSLRHVNPTGTFFPLGGDRYAFEDFSGNDVEVVDGKAGKTVGHVAIELLTDCEDCAAFRTGALGLIQVGTKLVQLGQHITVVDTTAMKIERTIKWPLCKAP